MVTEQFNPIPVVHLFPPLDEALVRLLRSLSEEEWNKPTLAKEWSVKDIAAHLLDGNIRTLSMQRDRYFGVKPEQDINSYQTLVQWINALNNDWVRVARRMSPDVLIVLLEMTNPLVHTYFASLLPFEEAIFSVAWAGEERSDNWMHLAREYTEKWHHQQQIREAVTRGNNVGEGIMTRELFTPCIAAFLRGLPHTFRSIAAPVGTSLAVRIESEIESEIGVVRYLVKGDSAWYLQDTPASNNISSDVTIPPNIAWKLFCKGISPEAARPHVQITGDVALGESVLSMVSVMA